MHNNHLWEHCQRIDYFNRRNASCNSVQFIVTQFSNILCFTDNEGDRLYHDNDVVDGELNLGEALLCSYDDGTSMVVIWHMLQNLKSPIRNIYRFRLLFKVERIIFIIPHSYAGK